MVSEEEKGPKACRLAAMNLMARREHSTKELRNKLAQRHYEHSVIEPVLEQLQQERLLCDQRFAEEYVRVRAHRGIGPNRLRQELNERGISSEDAELAIDAHEWLPLAVQVRQKKFGNDVPKEYKDRAKQYRFLQYRGFTSEQIQRAINYDDWE